MKTNKMFFFIKGQLDIFVLDAEKRTAQFGCTTFDGVEVRSTFKNIHSCAAHEKSRLRALQRFQRNFTGE